MIEIAEATKTFEALASRAADVGALTGPDITTGFGRIEVTILGDYGPDGEPSRHVVRLDRDPRGSIRLRSDIHDAGSGHFDDVVFFSLCSVLSDRLKPFVDRNDRGVAASDAGVPGRTTHMLIKSKAKQQTAEILRSVVGMVTRTEIPAVAFWRDDAHTVIAKTFGEDETYLAIVSARHNRPTSIRVVPLELGDDDQVLARLVERREMPKGGLSMSFSPDVVCGDATALHGMASRISRACHGTALSIAGRNPSSKLELPARRPSTGGPTP